MEWFEGSINDAIAEAKVRGPVFMVAVHGKEIVKPNRKINR